MSLAWEKATLAFLNGLLGHANIRITLDYCGHVLPTMQKAAADRLEKLLG